MSTKHTYILNKKQYKEQMRNIDNNKQTLGEDIVSSLRLQYDLGAQATTEAFHTGQKIRKVKNLIRKILLEKTP